MSGTASIWGGSTVINSTANADNSYLTQVFGTPTAGQTVFNLTAFAYAVGTASLDVFVNGVRQNLVSDFTETSPSSFTFTTTEIETTDIVVAVGKVGLTGATDAAASAAASAASAAAALASYNAILALSLPALPLTIANGGTGQFTRQAALDALGGLTTKGDLLVRTAANILRLGVGADNTVLTADSTNASGMSWKAVVIPVAVRSKVLASTDTLTIVDQVANYNYAVFNGVTTATYTLVGINVGTVLKTSILQGSLLSVASNGTMVSFPNGVELLLYDTTFPQGLWLNGTVTYGRARTVTGNKYAGSFMLDATTLIVGEVSSSVSNTFFIHVINITTGVINTTTYAAAGLTLFTAAVANADSVFFNFYSNGASAFIFTVNLVGNSAASCRFGIFTATISAGVATIVNGSGPAVDANTAVSSGYATAVFQLTATVFVGVFSNSPSISVQMFTIAGNVISTGAQVDIALISGGFGCVNGVLPTSFGGNPGFIVYAGDNSANVGRVAGCSYVGNVITAGVFVSTVFASTAAPCFGGIYAVPGTTDHFIVTGINNTGNGSSAAGVRLSSLTTIVASAAVALSTAGATDYYGFDYYFSSSNLDKCKAYRTDTFKPYVYGGYANGADNVLISPRSMLAVTSLTTAYGGGAAALTVGNKFNAASTSCKVLQSAITGTKYYTDTNLNITKAFTPAVPTFASGTTLLAADMTTPVWIHENLMRGNIYTLAAGVATLVAPYVLANITQPDSVIPSSGKHMVMGTTYCDNIF